MRSLCNYGYANITFARRIKSVKLALGVFNCERTPVEHRDPGQRKIIEQRIYLFQVVPDQVDRCVSRFVFANSVV